MRITMVKKRLANGEPCEKCAQTEEMLKRKGHWQRIDEVVWAIEGQDDSPGARIAAKHGVKLAPFFVVVDEAGDERVITSALRLVREHLEDAPRPASGGREGVDPVSAARELEAAEPIDVLRFGLERFGERCAIAFSGAEDVVLIDMATALGLPFSVFTLDTGRLDNETHQFVDDIRRRYGVEIQIHLPDAGEVSELVASKGPNSFYRDGHWECCSIRKFRPLERALAGFDAWVTGQRRDSRFVTDLPVIQIDPAFGATGLVRLNPLARWPRVAVFDYIRRHRVPTNPLHERGFASIGCSPCTRARGEDPDRPDRWWWEDRSGETPPAPDPGSGI